MDENTNNVNPEVETVEEPMASIDTTKPIVGAGRDETMDIMSLLKSHDSAPETSEPPKKKSAIELAKEQKERNQKGLVVNTQELIDKNTKKPVANKTEKDAMDEIETYKQEQESMIEAAGKVVMTGAPKTALEMASMMDSLENVAKTGSVESDPTKDANPERFKETKIEDSKLLRLKTEEELENSSTDKALLEGVDPSELKSTTPEEDAKKAEEEEKKLIATVLIDKTNLGGEFAFTEEERDKLFMSTEIHLKEIENIELSTLKVRKADKSFVEAASEYQFSSSQTMMTFPASRFRAEMAGLTYGEMGDISLNTLDNDNISFEQVRKKLTVIYNKMRNPSCGKFESFDDFLKKFAYVDLDLAVFGLVVSSFPEVDDIPMNCQNPKCKKSFNHRFSPRSLLRLDKCSRKFLDDMKLIVESDNASLPSLIETSPTQNYKMIRLPMSKFIIKLGIASAYDYLYTIVDNTLGNKFEEEHPDDVNGILQINSVLLSLIRSVLVPEGDEYVEYDQFEDMIHALYSIKPEEIKILSTILQKYNNTYAVPFELIDITCPHCGTKTKSIPIDINYLVFLKYQRLMSEELNIDNISLL